MFGLTGTHLYLLLSWALKCLYGWVFGVLREKNQKSLWNTIPKCWELWDGVGSCHDLQNKQCRNLLAVQPHMRVDSPSCLCSETADLSNWPVSKSCKCKESAKEFPIRLPRPICHDTETTCHQTPKVGGNNLSYTSRIKMNCVGFLSQKLVKVLQLAKCIKHKETHCNGKRLWELATQSSDVDVPHLHVHLNIFRFVLSAAELKISVITGCAEDLTGLSSLT